jgi:hypothetical protein
VVAAPCSQWIACSPVRKMHHGWPLNRIVRRHMIRGAIISGIGIIGLVVAIGAFFVLPDPQSVLVAAVGVLVSLICLFLLKVSAEPAVGTDDAPPSDPA